MSRKVGIIATQENDTTMNDLDDLHARPDPYVELVWENGQVIMQGQPNNNAITANSDVSQGITDANESKTIRLTTMESVSGNFPLPVTSSDTGLFQNGEMARWFNYSIRDPTLDDYTAQLLHDLSGATFNDLSLENILPSKERRSNFNGDGSRNTNNSVDERDHVISIDSVCKASSSMCAFTNMRLQRLNSGPGTSSRVGNFCHIRSLGGVSSNDLTKLDNNEDRDNTPNDSSPKKVHVGENNVERVVAVSSVCSGNSGGRGSSEAERDLKRKSRENGDSDGPSEEHESGSVGATQGSTVRKGAKRNRVAEVHNLSERRRRDRINEKMRALQELIPNCNKADKASMLDEAIEYLKTLQNQVQMLSVGPGMYIPPMALPHGMQHLNGACMSQSSHVGGRMNMGLGLNMGLNMNMGPNMNMGLNMMNMNMGLGGMGYGTNMLNNSNNSMKLTSFQGQQQFLGQQNPIPVERIYQGMSNSGLTIGHPCPNQGVPLSIQGVPGLPVSGALTLKIPIESSFLGLAATHSAPSSSQEVGSQVTMPVPNVIDSVSQPSVQTSNESIVRAVRSNDQSQTRNA